MGAPIIGRTTCPECGFGSAHVKQSAKCVFRYCPDCGAQYHARGAAQEGRLMEKTRLEAASPPTPTPTPPTPTQGEQMPTDQTDTGMPTPTHPSTPTNDHAPRKKRSTGLF